MRTRRRPVWVWSWRSIAGRRRGSPLRSKWEPSTRPCRGTLEAETGVGGDGEGLDFDAFACEDVVELLDVEVRDMAFEQRDAACELSLDAFGVASSYQRLPVAIFLIARNSGGRACRASRMFGVALERKTFGSVWFVFLFLFEIENRTTSVTKSRRGGDGRGFAVGVAQRDLP